MNPHFTSWAVGSSLVIAKKCILYHNGNSRIYYNFSSLRYMVIGCSKETYIMRDIYRTFLPIKVAFNKSDIDCERETAKKYYLLCFEIMNKCNYIWRFKAEGRSVRLDTICTNLCAYADFDLRRFNYRRKDVIDVTNWV